MTKVLLFIFIFTVLIIFMYRQNLLPKINKIDHPTIYTVNGPLTDMGYHFQITFENASFPPTQKSEGGSTEIYFGTGILRIIHEPLSFELFQELDTAPKLKIVDLGSILPTPIYCGVLTQEDGLPKNFELWYQGISSIPEIESNGTEALITFLHFGFTRVVTIESDRSVDIQENLKNYITVSDLNN